jgi:hypothetical protein
MFPETYRIGYEIYGIKNMVCLPEGQPTTDVLSTGATWDNKEKQFQYPFIVEHQLSELIGTRVNSDNRKFR